MTQKEQSTTGTGSLSEVSSWTAQGKMSYNLNGQRGNFSFRWMQANYEYEIVLFGPLGISAATITGNESSARIETSDQSLSASGPEHLLRETLGLDMPVTSMIHWLRGVPRNKSTAQGARNMVETVGGDFVDGGWQVSVLRRDKSGNPSRIRISRPGASFLVIVKDWSY